MTVTPPGQQSALGGIPVIDVHRLAVLRGLGPADDWGLLPVVVEAFIQEGHSSLTSMHDAVDGNRTDVRNAAHKLKGAAGNIGLAAVATLCQQLETVAHSADRLAIIALLDQLEIALERGTCVLHDVLAERL